MIITSQRHDNQLCDHSNEQMNKHTKKKENQMPWFAGCAVGSTDGLVRSGRPEDRAGRRCARGRVNGLQVSTNFDRR